MVDAGGSCGSCHCEFTKKISKSQATPSMGLVYLPTLYRRNQTNGGTYASPMDPMGVMMIWEWITLKVQLFLWFREDYQIPFIPSSGASTLRWWIRKKKHPECSKPTVSQTDKTTRTTHPVGTVTQFIRGIIIRCPKIHGFFPISPCWNSGSHFSPHI